MRTYTIRHLRAEQGEVDIDFVLHGETGPASRWALRAQPGASMQILAPGSGFSAQDAGGFEWKPPQLLKEVLLVADVTALPAAMGILDELAAMAEPPQTQAYFEVDSAPDMLPVPDWPGLSVQWLVRDQALATVAGTLMVEAVQQASCPQMIHQQGKPPNSPKSISTKTYSGRSPTRPLKDFMAGLPEKARRSCVCANT